MKSVGRMAACALAAFVASAGGAQAAVVALNNASFEADPLADGGYEAGSIRGWNTIGNAGWQNPSAASFSSVPSGANTGWIGSLKNHYSAGSMSQTFADSVAANTKYSLSVDVGRRFDVPLAPFLVEILAGDDVVASGGFSEADIDAGGFRNLSLSYESTSALSGPLRFRFRVTDETSVYTQVNFDNVALDVTQISSAVPEPATWAMMIVGFGLAGGALRNRRRPFALA